MGTSNDVLLFSSSGTGAMDASVSNLFSKGDKVIVCIGRKIRRALGGDREGLWARCDSVSRFRMAAQSVRGSVEEALERTSRSEGRICTGVGKLHGRGARCEGDGRGGGEDRCDFGGGCDHRLGHDAAGYRWLGARRGDQRVAKGVHDSAGPGVSFDQPEGLEIRRDRDAAALLLQLQEGKEEWRCGGIELDARHRADPGARGSPALHQADRHAAAGGECTDAGEGYTRGRAGNGARAVRARFAGRSRDRGEAARLAWIRA